MYQVIQLSGEDGNMFDVPLLANGATSWRFKEVFKQDLLVLFQKNEDNDIYDIDFVSQLAFIMAMQAEAKAGRVDLSTLNKESMITWLEKLDSFAIITKAKDIVGVYTRSLDGMSKEKKKVRKPNAK